MRKLWLDGIPFAKVVAVLARSSRSDWAVRAGLGPVYTIGTAATGAILTGHCGQQLQFRIDMQPTCRRRIWLGPQRCASN